MKTPKPISMDATAWFLDDFLDSNEADVLFDELVSGFDVTNRCLTMADGTEHVGEVGTYLFADEELTSFDKLPEVWGARSPWPTSLVPVVDRVKSLTGAT